MTDLRAGNNSGPVAVPVWRLARRFNPLGRDLWMHTSKITRAMVREAVEKADVESHPYEFSLIEDLGAYYDHVARIAYLVLHPSDEPIDIDVGVPSMGCNVSWIILDGNHRLAAAIFLHRKFIMANISGSTQYAEKLFGIRIP